MRFDREALVQAWRQLNVTDSQMVLGLGTGSTVEALCRVGCEEGLFPESNHIAVSSIRTQNFLAGLGVESVLMSQVGNIDLYVDGVDYIDPDWVCLKGGGGAMTGEKLCANMAKNFTAIYAKEKEVQALTENMALPVEVVSWARSSLGRAVASMGGRPVLRKGLSELGNHIIDCYGLSYGAARRLEDEIARLCGVVGHGLFADRRPDRALVIEGPELRHKLR